jgi:hypothetical protein
MMIAPNISQTKPMTPYKVGFTSSSTAQWASKTICFSNMLKDGFGQTALCDGTAKLRSEGIRLSSGDKIAEAVGVCSSDGMRDANARIRSPLNPDCRDIHHIYIGGPDRSGCWLACARIRVRIW